MRIQNYGDWDGDRPGGHHPPACACYRCNEERRELKAAKEEERCIAEYDRRMEESQAQGRRQRAPYATAPHRDRRADRRGHVRWADNALAG